MARNSKRKGNAGELEVLHLLQRNGLRAWRNDQQYVGGVDNPDIALDMNGIRYHVECKRTERLRLYEAMQQAIHDSNGHAVPLVAHRRNRGEWLLTMRLNDFIQGEGHSRRAAGQRPSIKAVEISAKSERGESK